MINAVIKFQIARVKSNLLTFLLIAVTALIVIYIGYRHDTLKQGVAYLLVMWLCSFFIDLYAMKRPAKNDFAVRNPKRETIYFFVCFLLGLVFFVPTFFLTDYPTIQMLTVSRESLIALFMLSVFASVIAFVLFAGAVRKVGVTRTNVFVNLIPVFTAILSWIILDEILTLSKWFGISVVVVGLFVSQWGKIKFNKEVEEIL